MSWWMPLPSAGVTWATVIASAIIICYVFWSAIANYDSDAMHSISTYSIGKEWLGNNSIVITLTCVFGLASQVLAIVTFVLSCVVFFRKTGKYVGKTVKQNVFLVVSVVNAVLFLATMVLALYIVYGVLNACFTSAGLSIF
jgi:hypothetical protein